MTEYVSKTFQKVIPDLTDINLGITLVSIYFLLEFGSFQGLYPVFNAAKIPYIISACSILYALYLIISGRINFKAKTTRYFGYFTLFMIFYSLLATKHTETKIETIKLFIIYYSNYLLVIHSVKKESQFVLLLDVWLFSVLFSCFHASMQGGLIWGNQWLKDENHISLVAATAFPFAMMFFLLHRSKIKKFCYTLCLLGYAAANVIAHSRGGTLSLGMALFFCVLVMKNKIRNFIIIAVLVVAGLSYAPPDFFKEMSTLKQGAKEETADDRIYLWGIAIKMFNDHFFFGVGPTNYPFYFLSYEKGVRYITGNRVAHSTPIQYLAETGIVGVIFLGLLQIPLFLNWKMIITSKIVGANSFNDKSDYRDVILLSHACLIAQGAFHFGSIFLSLLPYPFYWCLIPFSEAWKNISTEIISSK